MEELSLAPNKPVEPLQISTDAAGEQGRVKGRADYNLERQPQYLVRYQAADLRAAEAWFDEEELQAAI